MPVNNITLNQIRKKARKTNDSYTLDEIVAIETYLQNLENGTAVDDNLLNMTNQEKSQYLASTRNSLKNMDQTRLNDLMSSDLSGLSSYELDTLRRFLNHISSSDLNEVLLPRIEEQEKRLNEATINTVDSINVNLSDEEVQEILSNSATPDNNAPTDETIVDAPENDILMDETTANVSDNNTSMSESDDLYQEQPESEDITNQNENKEENLTPQQQYREAIKDIYGISSAPLAYVGAEYTAKDLEKIPDNSILFSVDGQGKPLHPEFEDIKKVMNGIQVYDGKKQLDPGEKNSYLNVFLDQVRSETEMYAANTSFSMSTDDFKQLYADRLRLNLMQLVGTDTIATGASKEETFKAFDKLAKSFDDPQTAPDIKIQKDTLIGWSAGKQTMNEDALKLMQEAMGTKAPTTIERFSQQLRQTDANLTQKFGKKYSLVKGALKSAAWGAAYSVSAATLGPVGVAAVAGVSLSIQYRGLRKNYKQEKARIEGRIQAGENVKPLTFKKYLGQNKMRLAGMALTTATAVIGLGSMGGADMALAQSVKSSAAMTMGAGGAFHQAAQAYKAAPKGKKGRAAMKAFAVSAGSFVAGMWAGSAAGEHASDLINSESSTHVPTQPIDADVIDPILDNPGATDVEVDPKIVTDSINVAEPLPTDTINTGIHQSTDTINQSVEVVDTTTVIHQQGNENISTSEESNNAENTAAESLSDAIDVQNLTAEQQHDIKMLFLRDPAEANELLGKEGNDWMNSHQLQEAWDKPVSEGGLTDAQKADLVKFAGERFDERGNFVDMDGKTSAAQMEADAKAWSAAHQSHESDLPNPTPEEAYAALTPEGREQLYGSAVDEQNPEVVSEPEVKATFSDDVQMTPLDNGDTMFAGKMNNGVPVHITTDANGTVKDMIIDAHGKYATDYQCTENEIANVNNDEAFKDLRHDIQQKLAESGSAQMQAETVQETPQPVAEANVVEVKTPENSQFSDVVVDKDNGDVSFTYTRDNGTPVHATITPEGELKALSIDAHGDKPAHNYTNKELAALNKNDQFVAIQQAWHQDIKTLVNGEQPVAHEEKSGITHPDLDRVSNAQMLAYAKTNSR